MSYSGEIGGYDISFNDIVYYGCELDSKKFELTSPIRKSIFDRGISAMRSQYLLLSHPV